MPLKLRQEPGLAEWLVTTQRPPFQAAEAQRFMTPTTGTLPPNPSDLINEPLLAQIFAVLGGGGVDYAIVYSTPLPTVVDKMTLANYADLVLSVENVAHTPAATLCRAYRDARHAGPAARDNY